jgi:hypothetical protein
MMPSRPPRRRELIVTGIDIRPAEPGDAEGIARVCADGWRDTYAAGLKDAARIEG